MKKNFLIFIIILLGFTLLHSNEADSLFIPSRILIEGLPEFPENIKLDEPFTRIVLQVEIKADSTLGNISLISGDERFFESGKKFVSTQKFFPAKLNGKNIDDVTQTAILFMEDNQIQMPSETKKDTISIKKLLTSIKKYSLTRVENNPNSKKLPFTISHQFLSIGQSEKDHLIKDGSFTLINDVEKQFYTIERNLPFRKMYLTKMYAYLARDDFYTKPAITYVELSSGYDDLNYANLNFRKQDFFNIPNLYGSFAFFAQDGLWLDEYQKSSDFDITTGYFFSPNSKISLSYQTFNHELSGQMLFAVQDSFVKEKINNLSVEYFYNNLKLGFRRNTIDFDSETIETSNNFSQTYVSYYHNLNTNWIANYTVNLETFKFKEILFSANIESKKEFNSFINFSINDEDNYLYNLQLNSIILPSFSLINRNFHFNDNLLINNQINNIEKYDAYGLLFEYKKNRNTTIIEAGLKKYNNYDYKIYSSFFCDYYYEKQNYEFNIQENLDFSKKNDDLLKQQCDINLTKKLNYNNKIGCGVTNYIYYENNQTDIVFNSYIKFNITEFFELRGNFFNMSDEKKYMNFNLKRPLAYVELRWIFLN